MRIVILFLLLLTFFWSYTSWYWYTCKIKGFCSNNKIKKENSISENQSNLEENNFNTNKDINNIVSTGELFKENILSLEDKEIENNKKESIKQEKQDQEKLEKVIKQECKDILTKPILLGSKDNIIEEVKKLEQFLNNYEKEDLEINGIYENSDLEAVKRLQLKYHKDILDPWGIKIPTGYVYKTTIKKINTLYCLK